MSRTALLRSRFDRRLRLSSVVVLLAVACGDGSSDPASATASAGASTGSGSSGTAGSSGDGGGGGATTSSTSSAGGAGGRIGSGPCGSGKVQVVPCTSCGGVGGGGGMDCMETPPYCVDASNIHCDESAYPPCSLIEAGPGLCPSGFEPEDGVFTCVCV